MLHGNADWSCLGLDSVQSRQIYSYNGTFEVGPNSTQLSHKSIAIIV